MVKTDTVKNNAENKQWSLHYLIKDFKDAYS